MEILDKFDAAILKELQADGRLTNTELAQRVGLSAAPCWRRVRALEQAGSKRLVVAGGVSANQKLRERLQRLAEKLGVQVYFPRPEFSTDNGAMIAYAGYRRLAAGQSAPLAIEAQPRWSLESLSAPA